ncbi:MAG: hypothetical protein JNK46_20550 [Methylobacteriaceae bacterium]|nr:hypothetical protein [Methylobacteriaceae bacterium]
MARDDSADRRAATGLNRRSALRALGGATAAAATAPVAGEAMAQSADARRAKPRFKADSDAVKTFYRVNRY